MLYKEQIEAIEKLTGLKRNHLLREHDQFIKWGKKYSDEKAFSLFIDSNEITYKSFPMNHMDDKEIIPLPNKWVEPIQKILNMSIRYLKTNKIQQLIGLLKDAKISFWVKYNSYGFTSSIIYVTWDEMKDEYIMELKYQDKSEFIIRNKSYTELKWEATQILKRGFVIE